MYKPSELEEFLSLSVYVTRAELISMWKSCDKEVETVLQVSVTGC